MSVKSIPEGVQAVFPMLVCQSPEAEMNFCAAAFGAVEQVRRPGPDGSPIHIAMRINDAFVVAQSAFPDVVASRAPVADGTLLGTPRSVSCAKIANASASFASFGMPKSSCVRTSTPTRSANIRRNVGFFAPPPPRTICAS